MNTRVGKIAQLPKATREQLNQRLENGQQGPELLEWLNLLPETQTLLAEKFDRQPISKSNLSDWRQGGYRDWVKDNARKECIKHLSESGTALAKAECGDLFENFARIAVAELAADLDALDEIEDRDARWQKLRELTRELARLQNGYNRSRWAALAWTKFNGTENTNPTDSSVQSEIPTPNSELRTPPAPVVPNRAKSHEVCEERFIHYAHCGCVCRKCHPKEGPYPYWDAEHDAADWNGGIIRRENGETFTVHHWPCDCTCQRCDSKGLPEPPGTARKSVFHIIRTTKCDCNGICQKCHGPDSEYPMAELLSDKALPREPNNRLGIRHANGTSTCLRVGYCECTCEPCKQAKEEEIKKYWEARAPQNAEEAKAL